MIRRKTSNRKSRDFRGKEGCSIGVALDHYHCQQVILQDTKVEQISNTVEFRHQTITTPVVTPKDQILHGITRLTDALIDAPTAQSDAQYQAIASLCNASNSWSDPNEKPDPAVPTPRLNPAQTRCAIKILERKLKQTP